MGTSENVQAWSKTAASNSTADSGVGTVADSTNADAVDDIIRAIMASVAKYVDDTDGGLTLSGTNTLTVSTNQSLSAGHIAAGLKITARVANTNTGAVTLNVDSTGAVAVVTQTGAALAGGELVAGMMATFIYNSDTSDWRLAGSTGSIGKQAIWIPAAAMTPRITNGPSVGLLEMSTNKNMVSTLDFDASTIEYAQFDWLMPSSWNEGTVTFKPVWSHPSTTTNFGVVWAMDAVAISNDDALDVAFGTSAVSADTGGTTNDAYIGPECSAITVAGTPAAGDLVQFRVYRIATNGSDTLAVDARLHGIVLYITTDAAVDS